MMRGNCKAMRNLKELMLGGLFVALLTATSCVPGSEPAGGSDRPNVIILFSDQHNKKVMGFEGHPDVITPRLDQLAREGIVFDRAYCAQGICVPSRSAMMTGLSVRTLGFVNNGGFTSVMNEVVPMARIFKENGYATYAFGKRHLRDSIDAGWDVKKGHAYHPDDDDDYVRWIGREGYAREFAHDWAAEFGRGPRGSTWFDTIIPTADLGTRISELPEGYTMEAYTTMETIRMIEAHAGSERPFFCWANFYRPHQPYNPLPRYMEMYDVSRWGEGTRAGDAIKMPGSFYEPTQHLPPQLQGQRNGNNKVWNMDVAFADEQLWRNYIGAYYALVTEIDHHVGEILDALEENGLENETIVIYTSDHGDFVGNHGMVEKCALGQNVYEDILNIPLIIKYPGSKENGRRVGQLVSNMDILPTLIELLDLKVPELKHPIQGLSLVDLLHNGSWPDREFIISEGWSQAAVITKDFKLGIMLDPTPAHPELDYREFGDMFFDRNNDPLEMHNGINHPDYSGQIDTLRAYFDSYVARTPAPGKEEMVRKLTEK